MIQSMHCSYIIIIIIIIIVVVVIIIIVVVVINVTYILQIEKFSLFLPHAGKGKVKQIIYVIFCSLMLGRYVTKL